MKQESSKGGRDEDRRSAGSDSIAILNFDELQLKMEVDSADGQPGYRRDLEDIPEEDVEVEVHETDQQKHIVIPEIVVEDWEQKKEDKVDTDTDTEKKIDETIEEHSGVIGKIDALINDLEEEIERSTERARSISVSVDIQGDDIDSNSQLSHTTEESSDHAQEQSADTLAERGWTSRPHGLSEDVVYSIYQNNIKIGEVIKSQDEKEINLSSGNSWMSHPDDDVSIREMILAFSALHNTSKIMRMDAVAEDLDFLHGIRFLSLTWVILGHTVVFSLPITDNPKWALDLANNNISFQIVLQGTFAVDSFFFISGLLMSYLSLERGTKLRSLPGILKMIVHRLVRLSPAYLALIVLIEPLSFFLCSGPFCPAVLPLNCPNYWWRNILNIQNFFPYSEMCAGWTWYLALDFQLFLVAVLVLYTFYKVAPLGMVLLPGLLLGTWITTFVLAGDNHLSPNILDTVFDEDTTFDIYYDKPYTRAGPYIIGMVAGFILHRCSRAAKFGEPVRVGLMTQLVCWFLSAAVGLGVIFGLYKADLSEYVSAGYLSLARSAWALCLTWISVSCYTGYGGPVNTILSLPFFRPVSRLTYAAYLIHPVIMQVYFGNLEVPFHASIPGFMITNLGLLSLSYTVAFLFSLVFESPWLCIQKLLGL